MTMYRDSVVPFGSKPASVTDVASGAGTDLIKTAHRLTSDLAAPRASIYWLDLTLCGVAIFGGLAVTVRLGLPVAIISGLVCGLALYRAVSFIHELAHLKRGDVPGFRLAWTVLIGVPFLTPTLLYDDVHHLHHSKQRYGTVEDPEYAPLSSLGWLHSLGFVAIALLAPLGAYLRFAVGTPLSLVFPAVRRSVFARFSSMTVNPAFRRRDIESAATMGWRIQEIACWLWSWTITVAVIVSPSAARIVLTAAGILALVALVNQVRTLVAHAWDNDGATMTFVEQFRDSINIPPPGWLPLLWAPVGLRYHALHHLLPRIPYHNLGKAHRRLVAQLPDEGGYHHVSHTGLTSAVAALLRRTQRTRIRA